MEITRMNRKDTTVGPPLRILSLDGGGVRGYSMLIILQELMHRTFVELEGRPPRRHEIPKPCDHFDLIIGTGTGGLIALMLGRLRLSIDTCKDVYVRMTKRVFETDKTIAGIPYRSTLFKASKLEEAIRECVREHTVYDTEGNDEFDAPTPTTDTPMVPGSAFKPGPTRSLSVASRYSQIGTSTADFRNAPVHAASRWGSPNASLYDHRENRTKTAVTAVYRGSKRGSAPALLRSYDSRKETAPEEKCTIWQAGRATCATALAFKPIQIGHSMFLDEGHGKYNPAPLALDEAIINEWPGREIGVFISIGTGKRPSGTNNQQHLWWEGFVGGAVGEFAEARRRLISKIEGCEDTHQEMLKGRLAEKGVNVEHYYRLNVDVGVGEFGMNEWNRLSEISTNTRMYLAQNNIQNMNLSAAVKMARIKKHHVRWDRAISSDQIPDPKLPRNSWEYASEDNEPEPPAVPGAIELPGSEVSPQATPPRHSHTSQISFSQGPPPNHHHSSDDDKFIVHAPEPNAYNAVPPRISHEQPPLISVTPPSARPAASPPPPSVARPHNPNEPPPLPPKTPLAGYVKPVMQHYPPPPPIPGMQATMSRPPAGVILPYPDTDGPPPVVNTARKPEFNAR